MGQSPHFYYRTRKTKAAATRAPGLCFIVDKKFEFHKNLEVFVNVDSRPLNKKYDPETDLTLIDPEGK